PTVSMDATPPWPFRVRWAVILSAASFAALGGCLTLPGTLLPLLVERFDIRLVEAGSLLAFQPIGFLATGTGGQYLFGRRGVRRGGRGQCGWRRGGAVWGWHRVGWVVRG